MEYISNNDNTVTAIMHSTKMLLDTKPTWTLSSDKLTYTKIFDTNMEYTTPVVDINGNTIDVLIKITEIDETGPQIKMEYVVNSDNTVTAIMKSNEPLGDTKPSWTLSSDKLSYTKIFDANTKYSTAVADIYGNTIDVLINITEIDETGPQIKMEYVVNSDNTVTAIMKSNEPLGDTKPSWTLSSDKLSYSKLFYDNTNYTTAVEDIYGNKTEVLIQINQIDKRAPKVTTEYVYNNDGTVTVIIHSDEILADTRVTWKLSANQLDYERTFSTDTEYATTVEDLFGNIAWVKIKIQTKAYTYNNSVGPNITVKYLYDGNDVVTVKMISDRPLKDTKPSWTLSADKMVYTKVYHANESYITNVIDINGNEVNVSIIVNFFKNTFKGIDVSEYQKIIDWQAVKNSGIDFAIIRAGYRGYGQAGTIMKDRFFERNIQEATRVGMDIGIYFYSQAITVEEARQEARYTLSLLSAYNVPVKYPIAIDTEHTPVANGRADNISKELRTEIVRAFCNEIQNAGYKPMIYANKNWLLEALNITSLSSYDTWLAHYATSTDYKYPYTIWQYTSSGTVNGIVGNVDRNIGYKRY